MFDTILGDEKILARATSVTSSYDELINHAHDYDSGNIWRMAAEGHPSGAYERKELKRKLYRAILNVNILEGIRFYVSFACSFAFGELKVMEGSAKIISLIARDESQHLVLTQQIIKKWQDGDDEEMVRIAEEEKSNVLNMFKNAVEEEKAWAEYLFQNGSMIGLNEKLLGQYVEFTANRRMKAIGLDPI